MDQSVQIALNRISDWDRNSVFDLRSAIRIILEQGSEEQIQRFLHLRHKIQRPYEFPSELRNVPGVWAIDKSNRVLHGSEADQISPLPDFLKKAQAQVGRITKTSGPRFFGGA